jgi:recombinational DNA repair protein RecT
VLDSLVACATLDLSLVKALGEAYLVPFKNVCTLMIGYKGFIKLIVNTGFVTHIESVLVYQGEMFKFWRDEKGPHWNHEPDITQQGDPEKVLACYAAGYTRDGKPMFEVMNIDELEHVRRTSKMADAAGPYQSWRTEMYRKAPIRRLQKWLPKTGDNLGFQILTKALEVDNQMFDLERTRKFDEGSQQFRLEQQERKDKDFDERMEAAEKAATPAVEPKPEPAKSESLASQIKLVAATWKAKINKDPLATEADFAAWVQVTASTDADMTMTKNWTPEIVSRCMDALKGTSNA